MLDPIESRIVRVKRDQPRVLTRVQIPGDVGPGWTRPSRRDARPRLDATLYLHPSLVARLPATCCVVHVSPLLRELLLEAVRRRTLDRRNPSERHLIDVLIDQMARLPISPLDLPMPRDPRGARAAALARAAPNVRLRLAQLARESGASARTLERVFRAETGLAVGAWLQRARMLRALELLAASTAVTHI